MKIFTYTALCTYVGIPSRCSLRSGLTDHGVHACAVLLVLCEGDVASASPSTVGEKPISPQSHLNQS